MSADNWADCPKCGAPFREDYEIGVYSDGTFYIDYRGHCRTCGGSIKFQHSVRALSVFTEAKR
jgi:hypothetical protein